MQETEGYWNAEKGWGYSVEWDKHCQCYTVSTRYQAEDQYYYEIFDLDEFETAVAFAEHQLAYRIMGGEGVQLDFTDIPF